MAKFNLATIATIGQGTVIHDPELSIFTTPTMIHIGDDCRIDGGVKIQGGRGVVIGDHVHIASGCKINVGSGETVIGHHAGLAVDVKIVTGHPDLDYGAVSAAERPAHQHPIRSFVTIGEYAVIFAGAIIFPGVNIGDYAVVGAGSVVTQDVGAGEVWWGVPARFQRHRGILTMPDGTRRYAPETGVFA